MDRKKPKIPRSKSLKREEELVLSRSRGLRRGPDSIWEDEFFPEDIEDESELAWDMD